jgi:hypothetical protein
LLHHDALLIAILLLLITLLGMQGIHREYPHVLGDSISISVPDLLQYTNTQRTSHGLQSLKLNKQLSEAAQKKAEDMFTKNYWAHVSPDGTTPWVFIKNSGYEYTYAGENLARGFNSSTDVVTAWMNSPSHRDNLLSPHYTDIGFAIKSGTLTGTDTVLVVQEFGSPYSSSREITTSENGFAKPSPISTVFQIAKTEISLPTATPEAVVQAQETSQYAGVATAQNHPFFDISSLKRDTSFFFLVLFLSVLTIDALYIERKQITRVFSHNVDHILFLLFILIAGILIGKGVIL